MNHQELLFEEAEKILSWRDLQVHGVYMFVEKETRGMNKWHKPITVVTVKQHPEGPPIKFYAPASLHYGLQSKPFTKAWLHLKMATSFLFSNMLFKKTKVFYNGIPSYF